MNQNSNTLHCDGCGNTSNVAPYPNRGDETLCPECASHRGLYDAAHEHAQAILERELSTWARHWAAVGLEPLAQAEILNDAMHCFSSNLKGKEGNA